MKIYIPLKDILLGPGERFDPSVNSEAEVIGFIKKAYGIISSTMEVSITDGVVCIAFKDATPARVDEALQNFSKAVSEAQNGNLSDALKLFKSVLEVIPEHIDARRNLAKVYLELGNIEQVEKELEICIQMNYPAASSGVSKTTTGKTLRPKGRGIHPDGNKFQI